MTRMHKLVATALVALLATTVMAGCGARLTAEERIDQARTELAQGDPAAAAIHMRNVLQDDPSNVEARLLLARAALQIGDMETAAKEFSRALDLGAELDPIRIDYAQALLRIGATEEALRVTDPEEAGDSAQVAYWHGLALLRSRKVDEAERIFQRILADPELRLKAELALARITLARGEPEEAMSRLAGLPAEAEALSDYWELVAFGATRTGDPERAADAFEKAEANVVDATGRQQLFYRGGQVESLLAAGRLAEARILAEEAYTRLTEHPLTNYLIGRVELQDGNAEQALAHAQAALAAQPASYQGLLLASMAYLALGQNLQAESHLERAVAANPTDANARRFLAQVRLGLQSPEGALEAIGPITDQTVEEGLGTLAGMASVRAGDPEAAVEIFRRQLETEPGNDELRSMLAVSLMAAGRTEEALAELALMSSTDERARQRKDLIAVAAHLQVRELAQANNTAARLTEEFPEDAGLRVALGGLYLSASRLDEATAWLEEGLRLDPDNAAAHFNLGRISAARGDISAAREHFETILANTPENAAALGALAQLDWVSGERESAIERLQKARAANSENASIRQLLASYLGTMGDAEGALEVAREAVAAAPESAAAANTLGAALMSVDQPREALEEFGRAHRAAPAEPLYLVNRARAELATNQPEAARETLVDALALSPDVYRTLGMIVEVERRLGRLEDAARHLARLEKIAEPDDARVRLLRGDLLYSSEQYAEAAEAYASARELGAGSRAVVGLFRARQLGEMAEPEAPLVEWLEETPDDTGVRLVLGAHYINSGAHEKAIEQYERLLADAPDNALYMNNLAWLYHELGDERALTLAERAHEQAPDNAMVSDTLGWILYRRGESARALALISEAAVAAPGVGEIQYHHAVVLADTGDEPGAVRAARAVLALPSAINYHERAQQLLDRLERGRE